MIIYNVNRRWFAEKSDAEAYRKQHGLKPAATLKIVIDNRLNLSILLNALCEPLSAPTRSEPLVQALVDRAFVEAQLTVPDCVPLFLIKDDAQRKAVALDRFVRQVAP